MTGKFFGLEKALFLDQLNFDYLRSETIIFEEEISL